MKKLSSIATKCFVIGLVLWFAFWTWTSPSSTNSLRLQIVLPKSDFRVGEALEIRAFLTNDSSRPVTLVKPGDGSEVGWRTPKTSLRITPDQSISTAAVGRCGNINALKWNEVFVLYPHQTEVLEEGVYVPPFQEAGIYRIRYSYSNLPNLAWNGVPLGFDNPLAMLRVKQSTACSVESNELTIHVN